MLYNEFKKGFLYLSKSVGLFRLSRYLTRKGLRIICYHGFALDNESKFRSQLFMECETLQRRLSFLRAKKFPVLTLHEALVELENGALPDCTTVITIDDGFYGVYKNACELLENFSFPATIYVSTYYCVKESPIFRLVVQYMLWKTSMQNIDLSELNCGFSGKVALKDDEKKNKTIWAIIRFGEENCDEQQRVDLEGRLGRSLGVDFDSICQNRILSLMNPSEITSLKKRGFDIQLHTHRHCLPLEKSKVIKEILDNRSVLKPLVGNHLEHLCYPSGVWSRKLWPWLEEANINTAVTCEPGFNYSKTPRFALKRFLDGENISQIEFEAEMTGYNELLRKAKKCLQSIFSSES